MFVNTNKNELFPMQKCKCYQVTVNTITKVQSQNETTNKQTTNNKQQQQNETTKTKVQLVSHDWFKTISQMLSLPIKQS